MPDPLLLPAPKHLTLTGGTWNRIPPDPVVTLDPAYPHAEGYTLTVTDSGVFATAGTASGAFYAQATLNQLVAQYAREVPCMVIEDWPDFAARGVMMDVSRDRVPTMEMLKLWINRFAALKINQLQLYIEHTFAFPSHPDVWREASPFTAEEIEEIDSYCKIRFIDLVPCQNGFGHMERWLKHPRYAPLAISSKGYVSKVGDQRIASTINPLDPRSLELIASIYDDLLPHYSSPLFNASADEPMELGMGLTEHAAKERGTGRLYLDFLLELYKLVRARGRQMQFWGDIIIHYPDLVPELPKDIIALDWGYEKNHDFDGHAAVYKAAGVPFYLCPGTSSWNAIAGRVDNMLENTRRAALAGRKFGAIGILTTDWGDNGHWQPPGVSWPGFAACAAMSWNVEAHAAMTAETLASLLDLYVYDGNVAAPALALGNVYTRIGRDQFNGQFLAYILQRRLAEFPRIKAAYEEWGGGEPADLSPANVRAVIVELETISRQVAAARLGAPDGDLMRDELLHAAAMLRHGGKRLLLMAGEPDYSLADLCVEWDTLESAQRELWVRRSRAGGLKDSIARFAVARADY